MAKPGILPASPPDLELVESLRRLEAAERVKGMTGESGELPGGVQGYVDEKGVMRFGGSSPLEPVYDGDLARQLRLAQLDWLREETRELDPFLNQNDEGPSPAARAFAGVEGAKALADEKEAERGARFGPGYVSGGMSHPDIGESSEGMQYSQALGMDVSEQPAHNNPYSSLLKNAGGYVSGVKMYYLDPETGEPDVVVLPVTPWQGSQEHKDHMFRAVEQASIILEENEGYLSPESIAEMRRLLATDPE